MQKFLNQSKYTLALIKSISGIRGTVGGKKGDNLTAQDIVECTAAFGWWSVQRTGIKKIVIGRDARMSGPMVSGIVVNTLRLLGIDVVDLGVSTTPTVEMAVTAEGAGAGIIITASHNPKQWNALKFLNQKGEFISGEDGLAILKLIETDDIEYAEIDDIGTYEERDDYLDYHIQKILELDLVDVELVKSKKFKVVVDPVNSSGAIAVPAILTALGCESFLINGEPNGKFAHNPEPLPAHLSQLSNEVLSQKADLGISVDPDVDRLAFVCEDGEMFGEEYTLVAVADYILQNKKGSTVSNLSSTRALRDITEKHGCEYFGSAVGEVNVVNAMKANNAVIGGEGNGGIIVPELHYGRDALVGIALMLTSLAKSGRSISMLKKSFPFYTISKNKIQLTPEIDLDVLFEELKKKYSNYPLNTVDGLKIEFEKDWVHLRRSNTEPIIRIYSESHSEVIAENLANKIKSDINDIIKGPERS